MDRAVESTQILEQVRNGNFLLKDHADARTLERSISLEEIANIAKSLISWKWQEDKQTHLFIGFRDAGKKAGGGFSAILDESGAVIITVFKRKLSKKERTQR